VDRVDVPAPPTAVIAFRFCLDPVRAVARLMTGEVQWLHAGETPRGVEPALTVTARALCGPC
jgi:hypothetical protein